MKNLPKYCILNYSSKQAVDDLQSHEFWCWSYIIRIISKDGRPFSRGDVAEILEINTSEDKSVNPVGPHILVNVIGDPHIS